MSRSTIKIILSPKMLAMFTLGFASGFPYYVVRDVLKLWLTDGTRLGLQPRTMRVDLNAEMRRRVEDLLGPGNFRVLINPPA